MKLSEEAKSKMWEYGIPEHMHGAITRYYEDGIPPGSFLTAVINNDLKEAIWCADDKNVDALKAYVLWFYNWAPMGSWGHEDALKNWLTDFHEEKETA